MKLPQTQEELDAFEASLDRALGGIVYVTGLIVMGMATIALYVHIYRLLLT